MLKKSHGSAPLINPKPKPISEGEPLQTIKARVVGATPKQLIDQLTALLKERGKCASEKCADITAYRLDLEDARKAVNTYLALLVTFGVIPLMVGTPTWDAMVQVRPREFGGAIPQWLKTSIAADHLTLPRANSSRVGYESSLNGGPIFIEKALVDRIAPRWWARHRRSREHAEDFLKSLGGQSVRKKVFIEYMTESESCSPAQARRLWKELAPSLWKKPGRPCLKGGGPPSQT